MAEYKLSYTAKEIDERLGRIDDCALKDHEHPTDTSRASKTEFDAHVSDTTKHITSTERTNWNSAKTHADSAHAPSNAEKNQNAFSNVKIGNTTIGADTTTDTLEIVAGSNITLTPDATNDKITVSATDTTYNEATQSANGLMSASDKTKLDGITTGANKTTVDSALSSSSTNPVQNKVVNTALANKVDKVSGKGLSTNDYTTAEKNKLAGIATGANAYSLPTASSSTLGGVKTTSTVTSNSGYTACPIIGGVPYYKDTNTTYSLSSFGVTATATELNYVDGVTSNIQTQLNGKLEMDLLWSNASPSSAFTSQKISLNLSSYDFVMIKVLIDGWWGVKTYFLQKGDTSRCTYPFMNSNGSVYIMCKYCRPVIVSDNQVSIDGNTCYTSGQGSTPEANEYMIPLAIYGIKGV